MIRTDIARSYGAVCTFGGTDEDPLLCERFAVFDVAGRPACVEHTPGALVDQWRHAVAARMQREGRLPFD